MEEKAIVNDVLESTKSCLKDFESAILETKNSSGGSPPQSGCHIALCPAAQRLGLMGAFARMEGIQSQCSIKAWQASLTAGSFRSMKRYFAQNHSAE